MRGFDITSNTLEDFLVYDDLFVEFFNAFLSLSIFPKVLQYDRFRDCIQELSATGDEQPPPQGLHEMEYRELLMNWVKKHRLPFFIRSRLYLEYKLCRLLLRKLKELPTAQSSGGIRGYSRATSTKTLVSPSLINYTRSGTDATCLSWPIMPVKNICRRPLGSAASLPGMLHIGEEGNYEEDSETQSDYGRGLFSREFTQNGDFLDNTETENQQYLEEGLSNAVREENDALNDEVMKSDYCQATFGEEKYDLSEAIVAFKNDELEEAQTEADVRSIADKHQKSLQELKQMLIGTIEGLDNFKSFLQDTSGIHLFEFWLDAERYKDSLNHDEPEENIKDLRTKLFREIRDKYNMYLTKDARIQIETALFHDGLTRDLFARTQYDILRRMRSYWITRYIVHAERTGLSDAIAASRPYKDRYRPSTGFSFLPTVSLVRSLPPRGDWCKQLAQESWGPEEMLGGGRIQSAKKQKTFIGKDGDSYRQFLGVLTSEKDAGGPLKQHLKERSDKSALNNLLFWQDVKEFEVAGDRAGDRLLRLMQAWKIVKQYVALTGNMTINLKQSERKVLLEAVENEKETPPTLFKNAKKSIEDMLKPIIEEYRKEKQDAFFRVRKEAVAKEKERRREHKDYGKLKYSPSRWYKRHPGSSPSERQRRLFTSLSVAEEIDISRGTSPDKKSSSLSQAPKKVKKKKKAKKAPKAVQFPRKIVKTKAQQEGGGSGNSDEEESKAPDFADIVENKGTITSFKQFVQNMEGRNLMNKLLMYLEVESYNTILPAKKLQRDQQGMHILSTYFDSASRRAINFSDEIQKKSEDRIKGKGDRPMTPIFTEAQQSVLPDIQSSFNNYFSSTKGGSNGQNGDDGPPNTPGGLAKGDTNESFLVAFRRSKRKAKQGTGRLQPSKEDKAMFLRVLQATRGRLSLKMEYFVRYLDTNGESEGSSKAVNNLMFYLEVQKFKELYSFMDDLSANRKVEAIVDCYLDSASPPWLQIDISAELAAKISQKALNFSSTKKIPRDQKDPSLFDDAQSSIFKEILPYWAGFNKQYTPSQDDAWDNDLPLMRQEKVLQKRYAEFLKFPNITKTVVAKPKRPHAGESKTHITFSFANGVKWRELKPGEEEIESSISDTPEVGEIRLPEIAMSTISSNQQSVLAS